MTTQDATNKASDVAMGYGCLVLLGIIGAVCYWAYTGIDSIGWMGHREDSVITAQANWFVGESKDCMSYPLDDKTAQSIKKPTGYAISQISCDGGPEHNVKITFFGRTEQPEYAWVSWRCTRNEDSFTCKQTGASQPIMRSQDVKTGRPILSYDGGKTWQWADQQ
jgi:hypothetical protein